MTQFKKVKYLRQGESLNYDHIIFLPEPLASWDVYDYWERERVRSMQDNLTKKDILFDVGAESGWMSIVFAKFCKVFLIEPTKEFWPNIYQTWKKNIKDQPIGCYSGLMSDRTDEKKNHLFSWPDECKGELIDKNKYEYINNKSKNIKQMRLDDLVKRSGITPTAITIDVEGAELIVLKGSKKTLKENNLKVWVSIHPDLMKKSFGHLPEEIDKFMVKLGYYSKYLATDHERHYLYTKHE